MKEPDPNESVRFQFNRQAHEFSVWSVTKNIEYTDYHTIFREMRRCCKRQGKISIQDIVAYDDKTVNDYFESFEQLVDASQRSHAPTPSIYRIRFKG